jgi:hypothetical protein
MLTVSFSSFYRYIRSTMPLDDLELRARYPPVDALGKPLVATHVYRLAKEQAVDGL